MVFVLLPAALQSSIASLRKPGTLANVLSFRVGVFAASAAFAAITYTAAPAVLQAASPKPVPHAEKRQLIKRRSSVLEPGNKHALKSRRSHVNKLPPGVAAYWDCAQINGSPK